jgi:hypothetical protein
MLERLIIFLVSAGVLISCAPFSVNLGSKIISGSGKVVEEKRSVSDYSAVELLGSGEVIVDQNGQEGLTIEAEDNILPLLTSEVRNNRLILGTKSGVSIHPTRPIRYTVSIKDINELKLVGSGSMEAKKLTADKISFRLPGSGSIHVDELAASAVESVLSGSGSIELAGTTDSQNMSISGSGHLKLGDLESKTAVLALSGSGDARIWAQDSLDISISGSGAVEYYGSPQMQQRVSGSGKIRGLGSH